MRIRCAAAAGLHRAVLYSVHGGKNRTVFTVWRVLVTNAAYARSEYGENEDGDTDADTLRSGGGITPCGVVFREKEWWNAMEHVFRGWGWGGRSCSESIRSRVSMPGGGCGEDSSKGGRFEKVGDRVGMADRVKGNDGGREGSKKL
ncbi:unnamed protein product [Ectocarpus sp. 8 AP-2014]